MWCLFLCGGDNPSTLVGHSKNGNDAALWVSGADISC